MKNLIFKHFAIIFLLFLAKTTQALTASFTADFTAGCSPLVIHFTNTSTGTSGATTYSWDLGNGTTSGLTSPSGSYITAGTFTVTLVAHDGGVASTSTLVITVYPNPTVSFSAGDTSACPNSIITFNNTSISGVPGAMTCSWNFGDGSSGMGSSPTHIYASPGYYNVTLSVTNAQGCVSSLTKPNYIHINTLPTPSFSAATTFFCSAPGTANFTGTAIGTAPFSYLWEFGDGLTGVGATPSHTYTSPGSYNVTLIVTDAHGCIDSVVRPAYINIVHLVAGFSCATSACVFSTVTFANTSSPHGSSTWYFGDGSSSTLDLATSHAYSTPGTYTVKLVVSSGPCSDTVTHIITILPSPIASFTYSPTQPCPAPTVISFTGTMPAGATATWTFGDGHTGAGTAPTNTYLTNGSFPVSMIVTNGSGCKDTVNNVVTIHNLLLKVVDTPREGCVPLTVPFQVFAESSLPVGVTTPYPYPYPIATYSWNFGDGSPISTSATPSHTYTTQGVFIGTVTVTTANGCTVTDTFTIKTGNKPIPNFIGFPTHICADRNVNFTSTSTGTIDQYEWTFGDGGGETDTIGTVTHHYLIPDTFYSVTLKVSYHGCDSTITKHNYITVDSPLAVPHTAYVCVPATAAFFVDSSIGETSRLWIFGDGTTSTADTVSHIFPSLSTYTVELTTYNFRSGCRDTAYIPINLIRPLASFTASDTAICKYHWTTFTPTILPGVSGYFWYVNNIFMEDTSIVYKDTFYATGVYTVSLVIKDAHSCYDTITRNNYIIVAKPVVNFGAVPTFGCWPLTVDFTDSSTDQPGVTITNHNWAFGDGGTASVATLSTNHTYTAAGIYSVKEIVTDNIGCKDTLTIPNMITVFRPHAVFTSSTTTPCANQPVTFTNTSVGILSSFWIFGDGDTSSTTSPVHTYTTSGSYTVKLVVIDGHGCVDTANYVNYITVNQPTASFFTVDSVSICPPLTAIFTNTSTNAITYTWFLGDGSTSVAVNPSDLYIASGIYTITLVAHNAAGCVDTAIGHVSILGYTGGFAYGPLSGCTPLTVFFNAGTINVPSIKWDFVDGITSLASTSDTITHVYTIPGKYVPKLILSDNTGCQNSILGLDTIKVDAVYPEFKTNPEPVCVNTNIFFVDSSYSFFSNIISWHWIFNSPDTSNLTSPPYFYNTVGTFPVTLTVKDGWGCIGNLNTTVTVYPPPIITTSPDTTICVSDAATLTAYGAVNYVWSAGFTLSCTACNPTNATPIVPTQYTVTGTDAHGCISSDTVSVFLKTKTVSKAMGAATICEGQTVQLFDSGASKYTWTPFTSINNASVPNPLATPLTTTTYMVIAQLADCIPDTNFVTILVNPAPTVHAGVSQTVVDGATAQIHATATNADFIIWTPASTLSCDNCLNPVASMAATTTYDITVSTRSGCTATDSVTIHIICDATQIFVPNTFTPNGDGKNDIFYPRGSGIRIVKAFRIYNRWGEKMFERTNINVNDENNAWDGNYGGEAPRPDVYVYYLDATCDNGQEIHIKGDVTIIR